MMTDQSERQHNVLGSSSSADQLKAYVTRIERLEEEVKCLQDDKSDLYKEVKACGFDVKVLRKLIQRRRRAREDIKEEDDLLDLYEAIVSGGAK